MSEEPEKNGRHLEPVEEKSGVGIPTVLKKAEVAKPKFVEKIDTARFHCDKAGAAYVLVAIAKDGKAHACIGGSLAHQKILIMQVARHIERMEAQANMKAPIVDTQGRTISSGQGDEIQ